MKKEAAKLLESESKQTNGGGDEYKQLPNGPTQSASNEELLRVTGIRNLPVWFEAGAVKYEFASPRTLIIVQLLLMGFVETKRYMDFINPGSQANSPFFGIEAALEGLEPGYPGGPILNPLGLAKDIKNAHDWKLKEIKNGRLAMVAMLGFFVAMVANIGEAKQISRIIVCRHSLPGRLPPELVKLPYIHGRSRRN